MQQARRQKSAENQQGAVADIRKHQTEYDEVEQAHHEGGVIGAVLRVGVHSDHPLEIGGISVVAEQNGRLLPGLRVAQLIGAEQPVQRRRHAGIPRGGHPALQHGALSGGCQLCLLACGNQGCILVVVQDFHVRREGSQLPEAGCVPLRRPGNLPEAHPDCPAHLPRGGGASVLRGGIRFGGEIRPQEPDTRQRPAYGVLLLPEKDCRDIQSVGVLLHGFHPGVQRPECVNRIGDLRFRRQGAEPHLATFGSAAAQRQVAVQPRGQCGGAGTELCVLCLSGAQAGVCFARLAHHTPRRLAAPAQGVGIAVRHRLPQPRLRLSGIAVEHGQCLVHGADALLRLRTLGIAVDAQQFPVPDGCRADFHASQTDEAADEGIGVPLRRQHRQLFHYGY